MTRNKKVWSILAIISFFGFIEGVTVIYFPETFMARNDRLSAEFTKAYSGPVFDVLRVKCHEEDVLRDTYQNWQLMMKVGAIRSETYRMSTQRKDLCLENESKLVVKRNSSGSPGYTVWTSGEQKDREYLPSMVMLVINSVKEGFLAKEHQESVQTNRGKK